MQIKLAFSLGRVWQHYQNKRFCIVSAYLGESSEETNLGRAKALKRAVRERGYGYVEMEGHWIETRGKNKGKELKEWPLFVPNVSLEDAVYFGGGAYYPAEPHPQEAIIFGDGESIKLLGSTPDGKQWSSIVEFQSLEANLEKALVRWSEIRAKLEQGKVTSEEAETEGYMGWSKLKSKSKKKEKQQLPWRFSSVTYSMVEPPDQGSTGWAGSMKRGYWKDSDAHDFVPLPAPKVRYRGAMYEHVLGSAEIAQHIDRGDAVRFEFLPKGRLRVLARTTDKVVATGSVLLKRSKGLILGYPMTRRKRWKFTNTYHLVPRQVELWEMESGNLLSARDAYNEDVRVGKISWHPSTGELLLAPEYEQHAITIHNFGSHPFDEYVRLIVLHDKKKVLTRPWSPTGELGSPEDRAASFEAQYAAKEMMERAGLPASWKFEMDTSNPRLQRLTGRGRW